MANCDPVSPVTHRLGAPLLGLLLSLVLGAACGDDKDPAQPDDDGGSDGADDDDGGTACASTEVDEFPDGPLGRPEDLVLEGVECPEGGLADFDFNGRWSLAGTLSPFDYQMPFIRESCEDGFEIEQEGGGDRLVHRDDTNLFLRSAFENENFSLVRATRVCASANAGELTAISGVCFQGEGDKEPQCFTSPGQMTRFGRPAGEVEADGLELVSEWSGGDAPWPDSTATNVKVVNGVAFLSRLTYKASDVISDLRLIDVSNPEKPRDLGSIAGVDDPGSDFNDVKLFQANGGTHALLAGGLCPIVDARDPAKPVVVSSLGEFAHSIFVREDDQGRPLAYLATTGATLDVPIYDLSDPANPVLVERVPLPPGAGGPKTSVQIHDLYAEEDRLYLNGSFDGFIVMDRVGPDWIVGGTLPTAGYNHASWVGQIEDRRVAIIGDEGFGAHLQVVDVDPESKEFMTEIGAYQTRPEVSIHNMMLFGSRVYLAYYHDGVRILDLADPTSPELVAYYHTWSVETGAPGPFEGAIGIDVDEKAGLIYVADIDRGLLILRETR